MYQYAYIDCKATGGKQYKSLIVEWPIISSSHVIFVVCFKKYFYSMPATTQLKMTMYMLIYSSLSDIYLTIYIIAASPASLMFLRTFLSGSLLLVGINLVSIFVEARIGIHNVCAYCYKMWLFQRWFNSLRPSDAYMRLWTGSSLVQIKTCRLTGAKPLSDPMLEYA